MKVKGLFDVMFEFEFEFMFMFTFTLSLLFSLVVTLTFIPDCFTVSSTSECTMLFETSTGLAADKSCTAIMIGIVVEFTDRPVSVSFDVIDVGTTVIAETSGIKEPWFLKSFVIEIPFSNSGFLLTYDPMLSESIVKVEAMQVASKLDHFSRSYSTELSLVKLTMLGCFDKASAPQFCA